MKQLYNNICGPFVFLGNIDDFKKIYKEMCQEYPVFKKMFENKSKKIEIIVTDTDEYYAQYNPETQTIFISKETLKDKALTKRCLAHEYTHFMQDLNIRKNFPGLSLRSLLTHNTLRDFAFYIFLEVDAYLKSDAIILYNFNVLNTAQHFFNIFKLYSRKFTDLGYAERFNFIDMERIILNVREFLEFSDCLLSSFTDKKSGGKIFPRYNLNCDDLLTQLNISYISNRNFDIIKSMTGYKDTELINLLYDKTSIVLDENEYTQSKDFLYNKTNLIDMFLLEYYGDEYQYKHPPHYYDRFKVILDLEILSNMKEK